MTSSSPDTRSSNPNGCSGRPLPPADLSTRRADREGYGCTECGRAFTIRPHFDVCGVRPGVFTVGDRSELLLIPVIAFKDAFTMKQSAAKTLGVAALGAAFAAVGAG